MQKDYEGVQMKSSREQFEEWITKEYEWADAEIDSSFFMGDDAKGHYFGADNDALFFAWRGWQAAMNKLKSEPGGEA